MDGLIPTLFCWILYFMAGLRLQAGAFFGNWLGMILTMLVAQSFGLFIGANVQNPRTALACASVLMLCMMLVSASRTQRDKLFSGRWHHHSRTQGAGL